jgi:putative transport protein
MFGRIKRGDNFFAPGQEDRLEPGDLATVVGPASVLNTVVSTLGEESIEHIERESGALSMRRLFVSSSKVVGLPIGALDLHGKFGAVVTRVRRGDADMPISGKTILRLGDRVRVVAPHAKMKDVAHYFGDSYRAASEIDILTFSLGLTLGLLAGLLPLPVPGEAEVHLGAAGGPLVVGLILGALTRTNGMVWSIPYGANLTLRQLGLTLFLAGVGTKAGFGFVTMVTSAGGLGLLAAGGAITFITAMTTLLLGRRFGIDGSSLIGMTAGIHTQPAVLGFANERAGNDLPNVGYASVYPIATVSKIVLAQLLMAGGFLL